MLTEKMKAVGLVDVSTHTMFLGEFIYIQDGKYYLTICNGYKDVAICNTLDEAHKWLLDKKKGSA